MRVEAKAAREEVVEQGKDAANAVRGQAEKWAGRRKGCVQREIGAKAVVNRLVLNERTQSTSAVGVANEFPATKRRVAQQSDAEARNDNRGRRGRGAGYAGR